MKILTTTDNRKVTVDDEDYQKFSAVNIYWGKEKYPYIIQRLGKRAKRKQALHRLIHPSPKGMYTDHEDGDRSNCTRENLKSVYPFQNARNRLKHKGALKYKGVVKRGNKFRAIITYFHKQIQIGYFPDEITAAIAYDCAAESLDFESYKRNFDPPHDRMKEIRKNLKARLEEIKKEATTIDNNKPRETSRYRGVSRNGSKWQAQISVDGVRRHISTRDTEEEAARDYDNTIIELGLNRPLNFPRRNR